MNKFRNYLIIWLGQTISVVGTSMTTFAMTIWAWEQTGRAAPLAFIVAAQFVTYLLFTPLAGVVVDRYSRKRVMFIADLGAGLVSVLIYLLFISGNLAVWHLYLTTLLVGALEAFHLPAYVAAAATLLPPEEYGRAAGMRSFSFSLANVAAPPLAGLLIGLVGIGGIVFFDILTFLAACFALAVVPVPPPTATEEPPTFSLRHMFFGFGYIWHRPELLGLQATLTVTNFFSAFTGMALLSAFILARTGSDEVALGTIQAAAAAGALAGGALAGVWGGPRRKVRTILLALVASFLFNDILFVLGYGVVWWSVLAFIGALSTPLLVSAFYGLWQAIIPADLHGRVFAARDILVDAPVLLGVVMAGPLADRFFEPAMRSNGRLAAGFADWVGQTAGSGIALMFLIFGSLGLIFSLLGFRLGPLIALDETV